MFVTKANSQDIPALNALVNSAYRGEESKKGWTTEASILDGIRINEETLVGYFERAEVSILKCMNESGEICGTVYLELNAPKLYLGMFAVSPTLQGKGIGKLLMQKAEEFAIANYCDHVAITVISSRSELIEWYIRHCYKATGDSIAFENLETPFGDPKTENIRLIRMEKSLVNSNPID